MYRAPYRRGIQALSDQPPPIQLTSLNPSGMEARRVYFGSLLRLGFTLLMLHKLDERGDCTCGPWSGTRLKNESARRLYRRDGLVQPCGNPGKHPVKSAKRSVVSTVEAIEEHLDQGGSIGLCLRINGLPTAPVPLLVWDCDRAGSYEWLLTHGITSDLEVYGKRGQHVLALLADGVPPLRSDTSRLNPGKNQPTTPERPGIDIKVSGLVVTPYSPNKRLFYKGRDISQSPAEVQAVFASLDSLLAVLPKFDPRTLVPGMTEAEGPEQEDPTLTGDEVALAVSNSKPKPSKRRELSDTRTPKDEVKGFLKGIPYHERKRLAQDFLRRTIAAESRHDANTFRVICTLIKRYFLSEDETLVLLKRLYVPRVTDASGTRKPPEDKDLTRLIIRISEGPYRDPIPPIEDPIELATIRATLIDKLRKRDARSNTKRLERGRQATLEDFASIGRFLEEVGGCPSEEEQAAPFWELFEQCNAWMRIHCFGSVITKKRLGDALTHLGYQKRRVRNENGMVQMVVGVRSKPWLMVC